MPNITRRKIKIWMEFSKWLQIVKEWADILRPATNLLLVGKKYEVQDSINPVKHNFGLLFSVHIW